VNPCPNDGLKLLKLIDMYVIGCYCFHVVTILALGIIYRVWTSGFT